MFIIMINYARIRPCKTILSRHYQQPWGVLDKCLEHHSTLCSLQEKDIKSKTPPGKAALLSHCIVTDPSPTPCLVKHAKTPLI